MMVEKDNVGEIEDTIEDAQTFHRERKPRSRERGPDKKPRTYHVNSMKNLGQFSDRPQEFETYLKDEKGIDISGKTSTAKIALIIVGVMLAGLGILYLYDRYRNRQDDAKYGQ
ncbi:MAG: hypothetical protein OEL81_09645 [Nitrosopumilus sp.]|nr:hypothetical protein [Nitrosopumilus sp.]